MRYKGVELAIGFALLIVWLTSGIVASDNYKAMEMVLAFVYFTVLVYMCARNGIYGETTLFIFTFGLLLCSYPFLDLLGVMDIRTNMIFSNFMISEAAIISAINAEIISLIVILFAHCILDSSRKESLKEQLSDSRIPIPRYFETIFYISFALTMVYRMAEVAVYRAAGSYLSLFVESYTNSIVDRFTFIAHFFEILVYIALACLPAKKKAIKYIVFYFLSVVPQVAMGRRGPVFVSLIFILWYYGNYIKKVKLRYVVVAMFIMMFIANTIASVRNDKAITMSSSFVQEFFEQQGVSFDVIANSADKYEELQSANTIHVPYFLGMVHKYFVYIFDRLTFRNSVFGHGQSMAALQNSSYLGWKLTYLLSPTQYIRGRGTGSSFVAENYMFHKYLGCIVLTFAMMAVVYKLKKAFIKKQHIYIRTYYFIVIQALFYTPRNNFWIVISDIIVATIILVVANILMPKFFSNMHPLQE